MESEPGKGSTFFFAIDLPRAEGSHGSQDLEIRGLLDGLSALVIDDNATNRRVLEHTLVQWGADVQAADNGARGLSIMEDAARRGRPFTLVLVDSNMPTMDGFSFAEELQRRSGLAPSAIMMLSSAHRPGDLARCRDLGIAMHLIKPVGRDDLRVAIAQVLAEGRASSVRQESVGSSANRRGSPIEPQSLTVRAPQIPSHRPEAELSILLAEDNPVNCKYAIALLEKWGHRVTLATNGREAIDRALEQRFDVALVDVQMPEVGGLDVARRIRTEETATGHRLPIIALTARAMKGDREECLEAGMDEYVSKPIKAEALRAAIGRVLRAVPPRPRAEGSDEVGDTMLELVEDRRLLIELANMFLAVQGGWMDELRRAVEQNDAGALERAAHRFKGSVGNFEGAGLAARLCSELENCGREGRTGEAPALLSKFEIALASLCGSLEKLAQDPE